MTGSTAGGPALQAHDVAPSALPSLRDQIGAEQIAALFRVVTAGVLGATVGAVVLSATLYRLGDITAKTGLAWAGYIAACAAAHILLRHAYDRARPAVADWRRWGYRFTCIGLAEGMGWGAGTFWLAAGGGFEISLLVLVVTFGVAAGAIPAFSSYLPAFFALFLPATIPYAGSASARTTRFSRRAPC